jgi:sugar lactone lactonase YvrE
MTGVAKPGPLPVEHVAAVRTALGEGPVWDDRIEALWWLDILGRTLHCFLPASRRDEVFEVGGEIGALALRASGGLVLATSVGFVVFDTELGSLTLLTRFDADDPTTRMNDGKCDPSGRFYAGTMDRNAALGRGALHRLDPDGTLTTLVGATIPNGLAWSDDGRTLYWIDTPTGRVDAFAVDPATGALSDRRPAVTLAPPGVPGGMCIDAEGHLWVALYGGGAVRRYDPSDGRLDREVAVPVSEVTSCAFGGRSLTDLYLTTRHDGLFRCRPGVAGQPAARCTA